MARLRKPKSEIFYDNVTIHDISEDGKGIGRLEDGMVLFVSNTVPQDVVNVKVTYVKKNLAEAVVTSFISQSPLRATPFCTHFGTCGGCKWQHLQYQEQLNFKQKHVEDCLVRLGKLELQNVSPILGSEKTQYYRNKLDFTFTDRRWLTNEEIGTTTDETSLVGLGFHVPKKFDKIIDVKDCFLQAEPSNSIRSEVRKFTEAHGMSFHNLRNAVGHLRNLIIRTTSTGEIMVIVQFFHDSPEHQELLLNHIKTTFPQITSLLYVINGKGNETIFDQELITFYGQDYITEEMEGLKFRIGPKSFYQTNSEQAYELYKVTRNFAQLTGEEIVYDLYTGTGTIANFVSKLSKKVVGIEYVPMAIEDAIINSNANNINNTTFYAGDMKDVLNEKLIALHGKPDVIITDPPRAGMAPEVVDTILKASPKRIVYVSCNPSTQARDIALMNEQYEIKAVQAVDMFPQTSHVESVVLLERRA
ncbi:MAG: hypothetical protein RLZZ175_259 [Bacteroidota bacterium]|jgi:23S rRNA (uracil1939-C5)-methyltransferase